MLLNKKFFHKHKKVLVKYKLKCQAEIIKERNLFKSTLIHDMKTPVLALIQSTKLLLKGRFGALNDLQLEIINQMREAHNLLLEIIQNFDFLLSCENKDQRFVFEKFEIISEIKNCIKNSKNKIEEKKQKIILKIPKKLFLTGDISISRKIIQDLINNAISLGIENDIIEINVKESENKIYFYIKNKSIYMSEEKIISMLKKDFDSLCDFNQLGISFNLNVIKRLINLQNWRFIACSRLNNVSIFGFIAPK